MDEWTYVLGEGVALGGGETAEGLQGGSGEDFPVTLHDMGDGSLILSQYSETADRVERVVVTPGQLEGAVEALRGRYGGGLR